MCIRDRVLVNQKIDFCPQLERLPVRLGPLAGSEPPCPASRLPLLESRIANRESRILPRLRWWPSARGFQSSRIPFQLFNSLTLQLPHPSIFYPPFSPKPPEVALNWRTENWVNHVTCNSSKKPLSKHIVNSIKHLNVKPCRTGLPAASPSK